MKRLTFASLLLPILAACVLCCGSPYEKTEKEQRLLFEKIKKGMSPDEVISILGQPESIYKSSDSISYFYLYFTKDKQLRSGQPEICFDSSNKVEYASFGD